MCPNVLANKDCDEEQGFLYFSKQSYPYFNFTSCVMFSYSIKIRDSTVILDVGWRVSLEDHSVGDHWIDLRSSSTYDDRCFERLNFGQEIISFLLQVDDPLLHLAKLPHRAPHCRCLRVLAGNLDDLCSVWHSILD